MSSIDHYENFPVASWLCPPQIRPAVVALYQFARTADDLADEGEASAEQRLADLHQYRQELEQCLKLESLANAHARWPQVFTPLKLAVAQHSLPTQLLHDLLDAFEQDVRYTQTKQGYANRTELLDYCRKSANPVGRLMLHLYNVRDEIALVQSDAICTALQLINFWQDRGEDLKRGRDYLPKGHTLLEELTFARELMLKGAPLVHQIRGRSGWELRAVVQGGLCILDKLDKRAETKDQQMLARPTLSKIDFASIVWRCLWM
jgi:squalene synthase HpnC